MTQYLYANMSLDYTLLEVGYLIERSALNPTKIDYFERDICTPITTEV